MIRDTIEPLADRAGVPNMTKIAAANLESNK